MKKIILLLLMAHYFLQSFGQCEKYFDQILKTIVYKTVDIYPNPIGIELSDLYKKLGRNIKISERFISKINKQGLLGDLKFYIFMVIDEEGQIIKIDVMQKTNYEASKALSEKNEMYSQIIKQLNGIKWSSGICQSKKVKTKLYMPLSIRLK